MRPLVRRLVALLLLGLGSWAAVACTEVLGIGDPKLGPGVASGGGMPGGGAPGGTGGATTDDGGAGSTSSGGSGGGEPPARCAPTHEDCTAVESDCIALVDNDGLALQGLRIQHVTVFKPEAFASGIENWGITNAVTMNLTRCQLEGGGTLSWLMELDRSTGVTRLGAAKPVLDPFAGYSFVDETISWQEQQFDVMPRTVLLEVEPDGNMIAEPIDSIIIPVYLNPEGTELFLLPLKQVRIYDATLSADGNCIGRYNAEGLDPADGCQPDEEGGLFAYIDGGKIDAYMLLEDADDVIVTAYGLNRSLCVLLSGDATEWGDGGNPVRCRRDAQGISFPGDWCSTTNQGATPGCFDAMRFSQSFAAAAVEIVDP